MHLNFTYRITYADGQSYDRNRQTLVANVTDEEYRYIMLEAAKGKALSEIDDIDRVRAEMKEAVLFIDRWTNMNGSERKEPLKKDRDIAQIEYFLTSDAYAELAKMKDPEAVFARPSETMTVYRNDGSSVTLTTEYGKTYIKDSREKNRTSILENDYFLNRIMGR